MEKETLPLSVGVCSKKHEERLPIAASVSAFRSKPIANFRRELKAALLDIVIVSSATKTRNDNDDEGSTRNSFKVVLPWKELCQYHDDMELSNGLPLTAANEITSPNDNDTSKRTTPLQEVVAHLLDPTILPRAYASRVVQILLEGILESPRRALAMPNNRNASTTTTTTATRWTASQRFLLDSIVSLWNICPTLNHSFDSALLRLLLDDDHATPNQWNRLLSVASHVASDCADAHATMLTFVWTILARVDKMEMKLHPTTATATIESCCHCSPTTTNGIASRPGRKKGIRIASLQDLHERDLSSMTTNYRPQYLPRVSIPAEGALSLKKVLSAKGHIGTATNACSSCSNKSSSKATRPVAALLSQEWRTVRSRAYRKFQMLFQRAPVWQRTRRRHSVTRLDLSTLLQMAHDHYQSPCLRLCLLLTTTNTQHASSASTIIHCHRLLQMTFQKYISTNDSIWLRLYTEIMVDWSCLDDRVACWKAIQPLMDHVMAGITTHEEEDNSVVIDDEKDDSGSCEQGALQLPSLDVFQTLAKILSRRSRLLELEEDEIRHRFHAFVKTLEIYCGEVDLWFDDANQKQVLEHNDEFCTLQRLGILGLMSSRSSSDMTCDGDETSVDEDEVLEFKDGSLQDWPFSAPFSLRAAYERVGKDGRTKVEDWDKLLTSLDFDRQLAKQHSAVDRSRMVGPPLTNYIDNPDLLQQIFHYCDYREVGKCRRVCAAWKTMIDSSNSLWVEVYRSRFAVHPDDPRAQVKAPGSKQEDWKRLFIHKLMVEQSLLHRYNQTTGWKHRTCTYIGCYHVLRSQKMEAMHFASHVRQAECEAPSPKQPKKNKPGKRRTTSDRAMRESQVDGKRTKRGNQHNAHT